MKHEEIEAGMLVSYKGIIFQGAILSGWGRVISQDGDKVCVRGSNSSAKMSNPLPPYGGFHCERSLVEEEWVPLSFITPLSVDSETEVVMNTYIDIYWKEK